MVLAAFLNSQDVTSKQQTTKKAPAAGPKNKPSQPSRQPAKPREGRSSRASPAKATEEQKSTMNKNVDAFISTVIDPDKHLSGFPGNKFATSMARQVISISSRYSSDGVCNAYLSEDGLSPVCATYGLSLAIAAGSALPFINICPPGHQAGVTLVGDSPFLYGSNYALFAAPVNFSSGSAPRVGYHCTVTTANMALTLCTDHGNYATVNWWYRTAADAYIAGAVVNVVPTTSTYAFSIPTNSTAFGYDIQYITPPIRTFVLASNGGGAHGITFGNHPTFTERLYIPDLLSMNIRRARSVGVKAFLKYRGSTLVNEGYAAAAQFSPGVNPSVYRGATTYDQISASDVAGKYTGAFKDGMCARFVGPSVDHYALSSAPRRFGASGFTVMTWSTDPANVQDYTLTVTCAVEYTTSLTFVSKDIPPYATPDQLDVAIEAINRMQMITENPMHEYVSMLWNKLKREVVKVATSPKTWYSIAEVGVALAAL